MASARALGLPESRGYASWQSMLEGERRRSPDDRIEAVVIVTPNDSHHAVAAAFAGAGIHVILDKPMTQTIDQADDLVRVTEKAGVVCCVTYNYTGYPIVKQARAMVRSGELGEIRKVVVEYNQGWLSEKLESAGQKQAAWRTNPAQAGVGGAVGDIGTHAENLISYVTGLEIEKLAADITSFVPGRPIDDDANVLLRFRGGAKGVLFVSQICTGSRNDLRLRTWGTKGGIQWHQENPGELLVRTPTCSERLLHRGDDTLAPESARASHLPVGHPEAFHSAFANLYRGAAQAIRQTIGDRIDFPSARDGARGVRFVHTVVRSAAAGSAWISLP